jgi:tetratricopeptide (TPR) repeat protein
VSAVLEIKPAYDDTYKRASIYLDAKEPDKAFELIDEKLRENPNDAQALVIASNILKSAKKLTIAYSLAKRASEIAPERAEVWSCLGHAAQHLWRMDEAISCYRKSLQRSQNKQQTALCNSNISSTYLDWGQFEKAEPHARKSLELIEDDNTRHNLGLSLLGQRKWQEGWKNYSSSIGSESRNNVKFRSKGNEEPTWDGTHGQTVCVYGEQGLGDEICSASMLPDVIRDSKKVIVDCDHRIEGLLRRSFPEASVHGTRWKPGAWKAEAQTIDASIAGFEVGKFYRNDSSDFPGTPYLVPCPDRVAMWKALFAKKQKPVIGIAWSGGIWQNASLYRQLPLASWKPLFDALDAHWVSLQYKDASKEIEGTPVHQYRYATLTPDYDDTAALVASCDLVIAIQTSVVHLAGALGVPCWSMIPKTSQWRYGEKFTDLPWYKSVKLIRQENDKWPIARIADELRTHFS